MHRDDHWESIYSSRNWGKWPSLDLIRFLASEDFAEGACALELGPGSGANLWPVALRGFSIAGVDISPSAVDQARKKLHTEVRGWKEFPDGLVDGSVTSLPFGIAEFDLLIDVECVSCLPVGAAQVAYAEAYRVAKPGARLFVQTFGGRTDVGEVQRPDDGLIQPETGPLATVPGVRLTSGTAELAQLLGPWTIREVNTSTRTVSSGSMLIEEFVVIADKHH